MVRAYKSRQYESSLKTTNPPPHTTKRGSKNCRTKVVSVQGKTETSSKHKRINKNKTILLWSTYTDMDMRHATEFEEES